MPLCPYSYGLCIFNTDNRFTDYSCDKPRLVPRRKREHRHPYTRLRPQTEYPLRGPERAAFGKSNPACADLGNTYHRRPFLPDTMSQVCMHACAECV